MATDMITRASEEDDFAPDISIYPAARDPHTGGRQLEALAFEVVSQQSMTAPTRKAITLTQRGVRRVFAIKIRKRSRTLLEFEPHGATWLTLVPNTSISDPTLAIPIPVEDLLDAAQADAAVARALLARQVPEIMAPIHEAQRRALDAEAERDEERRRAERAEAERDAMAQELARFRAVQPAPEDD